MLMTELSQTEQNRGEKNQNKTKHCCYQKKQTENLISQILSYNENERLLFLGKGQGGQFQRLCWPCLWLRRGLVAADSSPVPVLSTPSQSWGCRSREKLPDALYRQVVVLGVETIRNLRNWLVQATIAKGRGHSRPFIPYEEKAN